MIWNGQISPLVLKHGNMDGTFPTKWLFRCIQIILNICLGLAIHLILPDFYDYDMIYFNGIIHPDFESPRGVTLRCELDFGSGLVAEDGGERPPARQTLGARPR